MILVVLFALHASNSTLAAMVPKSRSTVHVRGSACRRSHVPNVDASNIDAQSIDASNIDVSNIDVSSIDVSSIDVSSIGVSSKDVYTYIEPHIWRACIATVSTRVVC